MKQLETGKSIKVAIADDHALFRAGVRTALSVKKDVELIAEADNGMQLLNLLKHIEPDVILLDIQMPIMDGIQTLPEKELRVLKLMCEEKTTKEIADIVDISPRTVEAIRDKLKTKTGAKSMAGLVMYAVKNGILQEK